MDKIRISKASKLKGDDGHKVFSVRLPDELYDKLNDIATRTERSRNDIITTLLTVAVDEVLIEDE